jgi:hypothetical protein
LKRWIIFEGLEDGATELLASGDADGERKRLRLRPTSSRTATSNWTEEPIGYFTEETVAVKRMIRR